MFGGKDPRGFTIVEVMVFLGVSGLLFLSAVTLIGDSQSKTEFTTSVHSTFNQLQNIAKDVSNGYYNYPSGFGCIGGTSSTSVPTSPATIISPTVVYSGTGINQGGNLGCTFIGEVVQFAPNNNLSDYSIIPIVGNQYESGAGSKSVTDLNTARPTALAPQPPVAGHELDAIRNFTLPYGLKLGSMYYVSGASNEYTTMFGFISNFATPQAGSNQLQSGSANYNLVPIPTNSQNALVTGGGPHFPYNLPVWDSTQPHQNGIFYASNFGVSSNGTKIIQSYAGNQYNPYLAGDVPGPSSTVTDINPSNGINICLISNTTNQIATINIGASSNPSAMSLKIQDGNTCP